MQFFDATWEGKPPAFAANTARAAGWAVAPPGSARDLPQPRDHLAALFLPDQMQAGALGNLRSTLARLRKAISNECDTLLITPQSSQLRREAARIDRLEFEVLPCACAAHTHIDLANCEACSNRVQKAAALYRGEFLLACRSVTAAV